MKRIISFIISTAFLFNVVFSVFVVYGEDNQEYEYLQLPIICDKLDNMVDDITLYKDNVNDILYVPLHIVCPLIKADWHMKDGGFYVQRDCTYFRYYNDGNMKLIIGLEVGDDKWNKSENTLLEGQLLSCKKFGEEWCVDFIKFCDMFGATFFQVSQSTIQSAKKNIAENVADSSITTLGNFEIEDDLDFKQHPYYIYIYSGTPLSSLYSTIMDKENSYLWNYSCYEQFAENGNWLDEIHYSKYVTALTFNSGNWVSNWINDDFGITKIFSAHYESSEHYKQSLVKISGVNYSEYLKTKDLNTFNENSIAQELKRALNYNTMMSSSIDTSKYIFEKYSKMTFPKELGTISTVSDLVNIIGSPIQTWSEVTNFHNKLNNIHQDKIELLTNSIIENNSINNKYEMQQKVNDALEWRVKNPTTTGLDTIELATKGLTTIMLNSIDNYEGLIDSSKEICSLYRDSNKQFQDKLKKSVETGAYAISDSIIQNLLSESGVPELVAIGAIITVYDGFTAWTKENFGEDLQNQEILVQSFFIENTMKDSLDFKNPQNFYNRLTLMLQSSLCCFECDENNFETERNKISKMLYRLDNDDSININYYHDPNLNNVDESIKQAILNYSDIVIESNVDYTWHLAPTIEAEDIIVSDDSIYTITPNSKDTEKASDKYSVIKKDGKYSFIEYNGNMPIEIQYDEYHFLDAGEIVLTMNDSYQAHMATDGYSGDYHSSLNDVTGAWGRGATGGYTKFFYDSTNNILCAIQMEIVNFDGYINIYSEDTKKAVIFEDATITKEDNNYAVNQKGKYGIIYDNQVIIEPIYDDGFMSLYNDIILLKKDNEWYYFNGKTGEKIFDEHIVLNSSNIYFENTYTDDEVKIPYPYAFSDGYVALYTDDGCGYYDKQGNEVIPCGIFEEVRPVHNGLAWVKIGGKWGVIKLNSNDNKDDSNQQEEISWKQLYADELKKYINSNEYNSEAMFDLYDINTDDIPELFISTGISHGNGCKVYTVADNKIQNIGREYDGGEYGTINCSSSIQTIFSLYSHMGHSYIDYYQIKDKKFVHMLNAYDNVASGEEIVYKINDDIVTYEKYQEEISKYNADDYISVGRKYKLDETTINSVLLDIQADNSKLSGKISVSDGYLNVRDKPSTDGKIIGKLYNDTIIKIISETDGWYEIEHDNIHGYVSKKYITLIETTETDTSSVITETTVSDDKILLIVNKYLEENKGHLGVWFSDGNPYCPSEYMYSNDTNWSCPINLDFDTYSPNEIAGAHPHFAYVDKITLECTLTANYETVAEFNLKDYL